MSDQSSNRAKGRKSYDMQVGDLDVTFFNRNSHEYPVDVGGPAFTPIPVEREKDISVNVARAHAKQEYERIMEMVEVLQEQARRLKDRVDCTEMVHGCEYSMRVVHDRTYYVYYDIYKKRNILTLTSPTEWCTGVPVYWNFVAAVRRKGDSTWEYDDESDGMVGGGTNDSPNNK